MQAAHALALSHKSQVMQLQQHLDNGKSKALAETLLLSNQHDFALLRKLALVMA